MKGKPEHTDVQAVAEMQAESGLRPDGPCGPVKNYQHGTLREFQVDRGTSWNCKLKPQGKKMKARLCSYL